MNAAPGWPGGRLTVNVLSTGHLATDHRVFDKEGRSLAAAGVQVRVFAAHPRREHRDGVELIPLLRARSRLRRFLVAPWRALWALRGRAAPIVHIHDVELLQICPLLKLLGQPVIVYDVHEDFANMMLGRDWIPRPLRGMVRAGLVAGETLLARWVDGIVGCTRTLTDKFPHRHRTTLYNLPSRDFIFGAGQGLKPPSQRPFDVVHVGVLSQERMRFLTAALQRLLERRPQARLRIFGPLPEQVERLRSKFDAATSDIRGKVPYGEVAELLRDCKVGINVHPFLHAHLQVAIPAKVLEYMACGCGVVTSWLPELDGLLDEEAKANMTVLRNVGPEQYGDAVADWLDDLGRLDAASERLRKAIGDRYCWEREADKLPAFYRTLLAARGRA